jgi:hypothetical protein
MNTFYQGRAIKALYVCSADNNPEHEIEPVFTDGYYLVPNDVPGFGSAPVLRDHLDSMRKASEVLLSHNNLNFFIVLECGLRLHLTREMESVITDNL